MRKQRGAFKCIRNSLLEVRAGWVLEQLGTHQFDLPPREELGEKVRISGRGNESLLGRER
jgi:hypothetical protein